MSKLCILRVAALCAVPLLASWGCCNPRGFIVRGDWSLELNRVPWLAGHGAVYENCDDRMDVGIVERAEGTDASPAEAHETASTFLPVPTEPVYGESAVPRTSVPCYANLDTADDAEEFEPSDEDVGESEDAVDSELGDERGPFMVPEEGAEHSGDDSFDHSARQRPQTSPTSRRARVRSTRGRQTVRFLPT
jgi:hypothetical protein